MDAIKVFDIEVDLSQVPRLYDYGRGVYIPKPEQGWDTHVIAQAYRQAVQAIDDETTQYIVKRMDPILGEKGRFEKGVLGGDDLVFDRIDDDQITGLPQRVLPVFKPGDTVSGQLVMEVLEPIEAEEIKMKFKGMASTNLRYYNGKSYYDARGYEVYCKEKMAVWRKEGSEDVDETALLSSSIQTGHVISPGSYKFPFSFRLPVDSRQSVPAVVGCRCGDWAHLAYYIKATIAKGKTLKRGNIVTNRGLWVEKAVDISKTPESLMPSTEEQVQETGLISKGKITCRATLPARAFLRGPDSKIPLKLEVDNQSGGSIDGVKACVMLSGNYRSNPGSWHGTRSFKLKGARVKQGAVADGMCPQLSMEIPLDFKESGIDSNLIPAGTLNDCDLIDVRYGVLVVLKRSGLHRNMEMEIPIEIGTENSREGVYPSLAGLSIQ